MNKSIIHLALIFLLGFLYQCTEVPTPVITNPSQLPLFDTSYISASPLTAVPKNILMEEFSGVRCTNCPKGNQKTEEIYTENPGRVVIVTAHSNFLAAPYTGYQDLRTADAEELANAPLGPISGKPSTYINRVKFASQTQRDIGDLNAWKNLAEVELAKTVGVEMTLENSYTDVASRKVRYRITLKFSEAMSDINLGFYLLESHIKAKQLDNGVTIDDYEHEYVLRKAITAIYGDRLTEDIVANTVIIKEFDLDLNDASFDPSKVWNIENMHLVAFIRTLNEEILQSTKADL